jgi:hypothetical protein
VDGAVFRVESIDRQAKSFKTDERQETQLSFAIPPQAPGTDFLDLPGR